MNLTKKQTEEVLSKFLSKENGLNEVLSMVLNGLMYNERHEFLKHSPTQNKGNGYRLGKVFGHGTQLELRVPRDRKSEFKPFVLALFRDQESYLREVSFDLYSKGLTTRDISEIMETIYGNHYSKSTISNFSKSFYEQMETWRNRAIDSHYLALYIDGLQVKTKRDKIYQNECFYIVMGLKQDYTREILAIVNLPSESAEGWKVVINSLKRRGLKSVGITVADGLTGLEGALAEVLPRTPHQGCIVHLHRNLHALVRQQDRSELSADLRKILKPDDPHHGIDQANKEIDRLIIKWQNKYKKVAVRLEDMKNSKFLTFLNYDHRIRRMLYTTNWIERFNKSARRTLKVRGAMPSHESVLALLSSVAKDKGNKKYAYPIYNFKFEPKLFNQRDC